MDGLQNSKVNFPLSAGTIIFSKANSLQGSGKFKIKLSLCCWKGGEILMKCTYY